VIENIGRRRRGVLGVDRALKSAPDGYTSLQQRLDPFDRALLFPPSALHVKKDVALITLVYACRKCSRCHTSLR